MSTIIAAVGWASAFVALGVAVWARRTLSSRMELVARAAHEVRGPIAAARLGLDSVARGARQAGAGGPGIWTRGLPQRTLGAVDLELRKVGLALDDLDAARAGRIARGSPEPIDVGEFLCDAAESWRPVATAFGRRLRLDPPPRGLVIRGDRTRLAQACGNLLANAIEHGGGTVRLHARTHDGRVRIEVSDGGDGLPAPVAELQRRARAGRGRRGRGLVIAAEIAERHGGRLAAAPAPRGARMALELPAR